MIHLKNRAALLMIFWVGTLVPVDQGPLFVQAQKFGTDTLQYARDSSLGIMVLNTFKKVQIWAHDNPKMTGALLATMVCGCLFALWRNGLQKRAHKEFDAVWQDGYEAAQDEYGELLEQVIEQELTVVRQRGYCDGWQSAMNEVHQLQQEEAYLERHEDDQQELDRSVTALLSFLKNKELQDELNQLLFQLEQEGGLFNLQLEIAH